MLVHKMKKALLLLKKEGIFNGARIIRAKLAKQKFNTILKKRDVIQFYSFVNLPNKSPKIAERVSNSKVRLAWFIPDFGIGSGGHLNIFRFVYLLEKHGFQSDIYITDGSQWGTSEKIKEIVNKYFFRLESEFFTVRSTEVSSISGEYDLAFATSWQTAYFVRAFDNCRKKAYFVQDFEPYFFSVGSSYSFAEETYRFGFYGITAGHWLKDTLERDYQMQCYSFTFSYDKELYKVGNRRDKDIKRILFYARPPTERRGFELGLLALNLYCKNNPEVEVVMAGWDVSEYEIPFKHFNAGVVGINELSDLYNQCDCALILSFTNLSLLPIELLASGCPVVLNKGFNNSWIDPDDTLFIYTDADPVSISDMLEKVMSNTDYYQANALNAHKVIREVSWEKEAEQLGANLLKILEEQ